MSRQRRHPIPATALAALLLLAAACSDNDEGSADGSAVTTSEPAATDVTSEPGTGTGGSSSPTSDGSGTAASDPATPGTPSLANAVWNVVLVASDDTLAVRAEADPAAAKEGELAWNATGVTTTGETAIHDGQPWYEVSGPGPGAAGWVNAAYLTPQVSVGDFAADPGPRQLVDELARVLAARGGDLTPLASTHGLYFDDRPRMIRFDRAELTTILTDTTIRSWTGPACGDPCISATFADHIAVPFVSTHDDTDTVITVDDLATGPSNREPQSVIRPELAGFHHVTVFDPGDDPTTGGLDWMTWYVYLDREPDGWRVVGLSIDQWAP